MCSGIGTLMIGVEGGEGGMEGGRGREGKGGGGRERGGGRGVME